MAPIDEFKSTIENLKNDSSTFESVLPQRKKVFASYEEQIQNLKSKGAQIGERSEECQKTLCEVTYYRMKGYLQRPSRKNYIPFKNACRLDEFDTKMRALLLYALSRIEVCLRCQLSYFYAEHHGAYGHLNRDNYPSEESYHRFLDIIGSRVLENASTPFVKHYLEHHGGIMPFWALSELLTFGHWVEFYQNWSQNDQKSLIDQFYGKDTKLYGADSEKVRIAKGLTKKNKGRRRSPQQARTESETNPKFHNLRFLNWLQSCRNLRNVCAHCGRLSYRTFPWNTSLPSEYIAKEANGQIKQKEHGDKLWEKILAVQFLYPNPKEWTDVIVPQIKTLLKIAYSQGNGLNHAALMSAIGFPADWEAQLNKWETL